MSTKMRRLYPIRVGSGSPTTGQVSHIDLCVVLSLIITMVLLRRTCKISNYTDQHNVDEDMTTIPSYNGCSSWGTSAGIFLRQPDNHTTMVSSDVASSNIRN